MNNWFTHCPANIIDHQVFFISTNAKFPDLPEPYRVYDCIDVTLTIEYIDDVQPTFIFSSASYYMEIDASSKNSRQWYTHYSIPQVTKKDFNYLRTHSTYEKNLDNIMKLIDTVYIPSVTPSGMGNLDFIRDTEKLKTQIIRNFEEHFLTGNKT